MAIANGASETIRRARAGTYSIVARDAASGELGVAVQSHWFSVGPIVPWAVPGVGAVATQANVDVSYGPRALALLAEGRDASEALAQLLAEDPGAAGRQVAVVDAAGGVAAHTGSSCMPAAGHATGDGVSCQANIMASDAVWGAMLAAFNQHEGRLRDRLLAALDAAEAAGGDIRGRQSAAILVVPAAGQPWESVVSLRVEDHPEPLEELRRLCTLHDAYVLAGDADALVNEGRHDEAAALYRRAAAAAPGNHELLFWAGLGAAQLGDVNAGVAQVREAIAAQPGWGELIGQLPDDVMPSLATVRAQLGELDA
ncbi:MAG TPA: DUF1028 domain-containing protein [Conexibacter sp.]|jgi:uncharacterized Ntn-hydrolase superfamily protein